jgi:hypothetical protein
MKTIGYSLLLVVIFCFAVLLVSAQNNNYLLLEYIKVKPGVTDSTSVIENTKKRLQIQKQKDHSVLQSTMWESVNPNNKEYQYVIVTVFKNFNDYLSQYKNSDSGIYYSLSKGRLDSAAAAKTDSFEIVSTPIFEMLAQAGTPKKQPEYLLNTKIKAASGKEIPYESTEMQDWLPIHQDLIKKGFESAFNFNKLIFPLSSSDYNYNTLLFFEDETMFNKQDDIDYEPYMQSNQSAFINSGTLHKDLRSELLKFITVLDNGAD